MQYGADRRITEKGAHTGHGGFRRRSTVRVVAEAAHTTTPSEMLRYFDDAMEKVLPDDEYQKLTRTTPRSPGPPHAGTSTVVFDVRNGPSSSPPSPSTPTSPTWGASSRRSCT